jgi:hypothetical protein
MLILQVEMLHAVPKERAGTYQIKIICSKDGKICTRAGALQDQLLFKLFVPGRVSQASLTDGDINAHHMSTTQPRSYRHTMWYYKPQYKPHGAVGEPAL